LFDYIMLFLCSGCFDYDPSFRDLGGLQHVVAVFGD